MDKVRPEIIGVHPKLVEELNIRARILNGQDGGYDIPLPANVVERKIEGGKKTLSEMAANELRLMRMSSGEIVSEIVKSDTIGVYAVPRNVDNQIRPYLITIPKNGIPIEYIPYDLFKKLLIMVASLRIKKDQKQMKIEVTKVKGMQKNAVRFLY